MSSPAPRASLSMLLAGALFLAAPAMAQVPFASIDRTASPRVSFAGDSGGAIEAGSAVQVSGQGFRPGQKVALMYGATALPGGQFTADGEGKISGQIRIPASAVSGTFPLLVVADSPYSASIANLKVSPNVPLSGQDGYSITTASVARGLYQSAYSARSNALFVTSSVGRPPVRQSELLKLNPDTLAVVARATPPAAPAQPGRGGGAAAQAGPALFAVYGVGVDDANGTVWATNTRQNTVAVYRQADLSLAKQFDPGTVPHARDVVIDPSVGKAYASSTGTPDIIVFDSAGLAVAKKITIASGQRGGQFSVLSLSLDSKAHRLYAVSMTTNEVAVIDTESDSVVKTLPVPGASSAIGVSNDPASGRIYVAAQGSDNLVVLDGNSGAVIADTPVGAGALNVAFDPASRHAYVSVRGAGTVAVTDADGKLVANLGPAPLANHASIGKDGVVYVVDKASAGGGESDTILRIRPKR